MRDESYLKSKLGERIKIDLPSFVWLRHEDVRNSGYPDGSLSGFGRTSWWEFKHGDPNFDSTGIQELTMLRLSTKSFAAWYVIWLENASGNAKQTRIVHPKDFKDYLTGGTTTCAGHDMKFVTEFMRKVHGA